MSISAQAGRTTKAGAVRLLSVLSVLAVLLLLPATRPAGAEAAPVVVTARVVGVDPAAPAGSPGYLVEVDRELSGSVPGGVLAIRLAAGDTLGRGLAESSRGTGEPLELTLEPQADGGFRALAVRAVGDAEVADPLPPPLAAETVEPPAAAGPRRIAAPMTAGAPFEDQVLERVNEERLANGNLPPLKGVDLLYDSSATHSTNMAVRDFFAHCDVDTKATPFDRMTAAGYAWNAAAENIAAGYATPQSVMDGWMASPGHRANILSTAYREIGVGHVLQSDDQGNVRQDQNGDCTVDGMLVGPFFRYWTQNFGRRNSVYPVIIEREDYETACSAVDLYTYGTGWAAEMRFSNDGATWSAWEPFSPVKSWSLDPSASGTATVFAELRNGGTVRSAQDAIGLTGAYPAPADLDLSSQTVTGTETIEACDTITAHDGFQVASSGDVRFNAPTIVLGDGFAVAAGGTFRAANP